MPSPDARLTRRALLGASGAAGLGLLLSACVRTPSSAADSVPTGEPSNGPGAPQAETRSSGDGGSFRSVVMIGDSITHGSSGPLDAALRAAGYTDITIDAEVSRRIDVGGGPGEPRSGAQAMQALLDAGASPDVWVIALGTNDIGKYADDEYRGVVQSLLAMAPAGAPLVWVDVYVPADTDGTETFDEVVRGLIEDRGSAVVASWRETVTTSDSEVLRDDRLHPNQRGSEAFASLVVDALSELA